MGGLASCSQPIPATALAEPSAICTALVPFQVEQQLALAEAVAQHERPVVGSASSSSNCCTFSDLARPLCVFREGIVSSKDSAVSVTDGASVLLGPVLGRVTDTTAVVLIEVSATCNLLINVARVCGNFGRERAGECMELALYAEDDEAAGLSQPPLCGLELDNIAFTATGSACICQRMQPGAPQSFELKGLEPETGYLVFLSNVGQEADLKRHVRFTTLPARLDCLRLVVIGSYSSYGASRVLPPREVDPWVHLHDVASAGPEVHMVLHLGSVSDAGQASAQALRHLKDHKSFCEGPRRSMVKRARESLQQAYRSTWGGQDSFRKVLAQVGSQFAVFIPPMDVLLQLVQEQEASPPGLGAAGGGGDEREVTRLALEVYREYQRALWDRTFYTSLDIRKYGHGWDAEKLWLEGHLKLDEVQIAPQDREFMVDAGAVAGSSLEEWHIHRYGCICLIMLDTKGSLVDSVLSPARSSESVVPLLSLRQWRAIDEALKDEATQVLVIASDSPIVLEAITPMGEGEDVDNPRRPVDGPPDWRTSRFEQNRLLLSLFQWKSAQYPSREVILLSSGPGFGTAGDVRDKKLGLSIVSVLAGPVDGTTVTPQNWELQGEIPGGRFSYGYKEPHGRPRPGRRPRPGPWEFCTVDIDLAATQKPTVDVNLISSPML
ncbi:unnamed protein product [Polarella glacialis]|uniref:Uncharacterized protein n=1 Tax=Polarella glacialis TaxID=89957 RepID=A0A813IRG7_POLGL|nr:unnamed protein product [Polarella glacialis]